MNKIGILECAFGPKRRAVSAEVFRITASIGHECEFSRVAIIAGTTTNMNCCVWNWLTGFGIGDGEPDFEIGAADPFGGLGEIEEGYGSDGEERCRAKHEQFSCQKFSSCVRSHNSPFHMLSRDLEPDFT